MGLWDGKCTEKELKSKCTDQREDTNPIKDQKVSCAHGKTEGQRNKKNADISSTMMSGSVGVESDRATNSKQFYPAFGINCECFEGMDFHLCARHLLNIGHFLQPRVSDGVHDQVGERVNFDLDFQR